MMAALDRGDAALLGTGRPQLARQPPDVAPTSRDSTDISPGAAADSILDPHNWVLGPYRASMVIVGRHTEVLAPFLEGTLYVQLPRRDRTGSLPGAPRDCDLRR